MAMTLAVFLTTMGQIITTTNTTTILTTITTHTLITPIIIMMHTLIVLTTIKVEHMIMNLETTTTVVSGNQILSLVWIGMHGSMKKEIQITA
jgi:hypothetical protein